MDPNSLNSVLNDVSNIGLEWYQAINPTSPTVPVGTTNVASVTTSLNAGPDSGLLVLALVLVGIYVFTR